MSRLPNCEYAIFFDDVHVLAVNYNRGEVRLFENAGSGTGRLAYRTDEAAAKASITDAFQIMDMGLRFGIHYSLLSQAADNEAETILEKLGVKDLLDRMIALTTDEDRRGRFQGFNFSFDGKKETDSAEKARVEVSVEPKRRAHKGSDQTQGG